MSKKSLVLVVGAGASKEVNLPVGAELKNKIAEKLDIRFDDWGSKITNGEQLIAQAFYELAAQTTQNRDINPFLSTRK